MAEDQVYGDALWLVVMFSRRLWCLFCSSYIGISLTLEGILSVEVSLGKILAENSDIWEPWMHNESILRAGSQRSSMNEPLLLLSSD